MRKRRIFAKWNGFSAELALRSGIENIFSGWLKKPNHMMFLCALKNLFTQT